MTIKHYLKTAIVHRIQPFCNLTDDRFDAAVVERRTQISEFDEFQKRHRAARLTQPHVIRPRGAMIFTVFFPKLVFQLYQILFAFRYFQYAD